MPIYEELFYLKSGRYVDFMRSSLRRSLITQADRLIYAEISNQIQEIVAGNDELARIFGEGFNTANRTLKWAFNDIVDRLGQVSSVIKDLSADSNYSIGLIIEQMQIQNNLINNVIEKLDAIHKTLESPLLTQAREFYRIGIERLQRGLIDKALQAFLKAEEKNDADFFTEFQSGTLYLYGVDEDDNVIDLKKAQDHLLLAIRYGKGGA
jgi:regulator of replication initiation timing